MTNEEKANEIGCKYRIRYEDNNFNIVGISTSECIESALEMAKWKDTKFDKVAACVKYSLERQGFGGADEFVAAMYKEYQS